MQPSTFLNLPYSDWLLLRNNVLCNGQNTGSATANPSGGTTPYRYTWSNGRTTKTTINLVAGMYNVTVTDANDCTTTSSIMIDRTYGT